MNINQLLEKYWDADTSLEEEHKLHQYFQSDVIAEEHLPYKILFNNFDSEKQIQMDRVFLSPNKKPRIFKLRMIGIAASIFLALAILYNPFSTNNQSNSVVIETPEEALSYTKDALALVSNKLSIGSQPFVRSLSSLKKANILVH